MDEKVCQKKLEEERAVTEKTFNVKIAMERQKYNDRLNAQSSKMQRMKEREIEDVMKLLKRCP